MTITSAPDTDPANVASADPVPLGPDDFDALGATARLSLALGDVEGALGALVTRRTSAEGEARNALDVQIATILVERPGRGREAIVAYEAAIALTRNEVERRFLTRRRAELDRG